MCSFCCAGSLTAVPDVTYTYGGTALEINVMANDIIPADVVPPVLVKTVTRATYGTAAVSLNQRAVMYTPPLDPTTTLVDVFDYTIADGSLKTSTAAVTVT